MSKDPLWWAEDVGYRRCAEDVGYRRWAEDVGYRRCAAETVVDDFNDPAI